MKTLAHLRERQGGLLRTGGLEAVQGSTKDHSCSCPTLCPMLGRFSAAVKKKVPMLSKKSFLELKIHVSGLICEVGSEFQDG